MHKLGLCKTRFYFAIKSMVGSSKAGYSPLVDRRERTVAAFHYRGRVLAESNFSPTLLQEKQIGLSTFNPVGFSLPLKNII